MYTTDVLLTVSTGHKLTVTLITLKVGNLVVNKAEVAFKIFNHLPTFKTLFLQSYVNTRDVILKVCFRLEALVTFYTNMISYFIMDNLNQVRNSFSGKRGIQLSSFDELVQSASELLSCLKTWFHSQVDHT